MNYSVFKLQSQSGKPSIFWEKEKIPKKDKKFSYKTKKQPFPVRRFAGDRHHVESDLVTLTPEEPAPPPKPAKNFIKRNRLKVTTKKEAPSTVTLTQEQLNAILKSVGKVAGGSENAVKISIGGDNSKEITIESPRRRDDYNDDDDDEREKRRSKKRSEPKEEEGASIYSFLNNKSKGKISSREKKHNKDDDDDDDEIDNRYRKTKPKRYENDDEEEELKIRKHRSKSRKYENEDDDEDNYYAERQSKETKSRRNKSKHRDDEDDDDYDNSRETKGRRNRSKRREESYDEDDEENRDNDTRERVRKPNKTRVSRRDDSKELREKKDHNYEQGDGLNDRDSKEVAEIPSPRDKIGLPIDLSWRHMTKAERRRLEMARQKLIDEEEKHEEERKQKLNEQLGLVPRRAAVRSDPTTRLERQPHGRETQTTDHTDHNRRDRRSRSPEDNRSRTPERTPDVPSYHSPDTSPKVPIGLPRRHMTLAEKKRLEWERDRVESVQMQKTVEPWGRPGAGAPLRSRSGHVIADYKGRQDQLRNSMAIQSEEPERSKGPTNPQDNRVPQPREEDKQRLEPDSTNPTQDTSSMPHAMRSSFVIGQSAPDVERFESSKERERKQWLADLEKQIEEKRLKEMKNVEVQEEDTWANKLGTSHRALPFPEQPKDTLSGSADFLSGDRSSPTHDSNRINSAPDGTHGEPTSYIRGQNVPIDPVTLKELEDKRQRNLDHHAAIRAQVDEKERQKKAERERKMREDMEEERKLQAERDALQKQFELEQQKHRQKDAARQAQVNQLKAAMDEAQARALQEKYQRKMERLEAGGHDTTKLREHLEAMNLAAKPTKITPRTEEPSHVPGLDLSTVRTVNYQHAGLETGQPGYQSGHQLGNQPGHLGTNHEPYTGNRVLTPSRYRHPSKPWSDPTSPRREFGTQTGNRSDSPTKLDGDDIRQVLNQSLSRDDSEVNIEYKMEHGRRVRVVSAPKESNEKRRRVSHPPTEAGSASGSGTGYQEPLSPHQHHHDVQHRREREEERRKKRLEQQRRHGPVKPGSRPKWGYKNPNYKRPQKQSEKDPFYEQKKRESERRRMKREAQLLAMVEKNKPIIPEYYVPAERSARSRNQSPYSDYGGETPREARVARRSKSHSPNRFNNSGHTDFLAVHNDFTSGKPRRSPLRERSPSPVDSKSPRAQHGESQRPRGRSPPIPAIKHRNEASNFDQRDTQLGNKRGGKYKDIDPLDIPAKDGEFVPFTRTIDVLDPAKAEDPMPLSREATRVANARKTYYESLHPEKFGNRQNVYQDSDRVPKNPEDLKNPIFNPGLVTDYPTSRQGQILLQLSTLKQSLMQRQRELETFSPSDLEKQTTNL